jgi:hypothetical protein
LLRWLLRLDKMLKDYSKMKARINALKEKSKKLINSLMIVDK